jgi:hypothetical protein
MEPPGAGEVVALERVAPGVTAVPATTLDVAATVVDVTAWTMAVADLALSVPSQFDEAIVGTSVYCHEPVPGTSEQVTTDDAMEQLPLMTVPEPEPTRYRLTVYAVNAVPPLEEACVNVTVTVWLEAGVTLTDGVAPVGSVWAVASALTLPLDTVTAQ